MTDFLSFIIISLIVLVVVGGVIIIIFKIKEARLYGKNITKKNKLYAFVAKCFLKDFDS